MKQNPIQFFTIPPLKFVNLAEINDRYFALAHLLIKDKCYAEFIKQKCLDRKHVIIDNGAAEGATVSTTKLIELVKHFQPTEVVVPDVLYSQKQTLHNLREFKVLFQEQVQRHHHLTKTKIIGVPQGTSPQTWRYCYDCMVNDEHIDVIGLSKFAVVKSFNGLTSSNEVAENRIWATNWLLDEDAVTKPIHFLGMRNPREFYHYDHPLLRSSDSCFTVLAGLNGKKIFEAGYDEETESDYFSTEVIKNSVLMIIKNNIETLNQTNL